LQNQDRYDQHETGHMHIFRPYRFSKRAGLAFLTYYEAA
jgi:hypothetical protein